MLKVTDTLEFRHCSMYLACMLPLIFLYFSSEYIISILRFHLSQQCSPIQCTCTYVKSKPQSLESTKYNFQFKILQLSEDENVHATQYGYNKRQYASAHSRTTRCCDF